MTLSMFQISVPPLLRGLTNLKTILGKAQAHAVAKKIEPSALLGARLFPDMLPLTRQIHIATDGAKGCAARLAGVDIPKYDDTETTFEELDARIQKTIDYLKTFSAAQIDGSEDRQIEVKMSSGPVTFTGIDFLLNHVLPNFYFHSVTTYDILRHNGVEVGKPDFLGTRKTA